VSEPAAEHTTHIIGSGGDAPNLAWVERPRSPVVALRLFLPGGSAADGDAPGATHVLEHLLAAGDASPTGRDSLARLSALGAVVTGETAREYAAISVECLTGCWPQALTALAGLVQAVEPEPRGLARAVNGVVLEALARAGGRSHLWNILADLMWPGHPLARPTVGSPERAAQLTAADLRAHRDRMMVRDGVWLGVAGVPDVNGFLAVLAGLDWGLTPDPLPWVPGPKAAEPREIDLKGDGDCSQVIIAWPYPGGFGSPARAARLIEATLQGSQGRLAAALRRAGHGDEVYTALASYRQAGYLAVLARFRPGAERTVRQLLLETAAAPPNDAQLDRARRAYRTRAWLNLDPVARLAGAAALHAVTGGPPVQDWIRSVAATDGSEVRQAVDEYLDRRRGFVITIPGRREGAP